MASEQGDTAGMFGNAIGLLGVGMSTVPLTDPSPLSRTPVSLFSLYRTWRRVCNGPLKFLSARSPRRPWSRGLGC